MLCGSEMSVKVITVALDRSSDVNKDLSHKDQDLCSSRSRTSTRTSASRVRTSTSTWLSIFSRPPGVAGVRLSVFAQYFLPAALRAAQRAGI